MNFILGQGTNIQRNLQFSKLLTLEGFVDVMNVMMTNVAIPPSDVSCLGLGPMSTATKRIKIKTPTPKIIL